MEHAFIDSDYQINPEVLEVGHYSNLLRQYPNFSSGTLCDEEYENKLQELDNLSTIELFILELIVIRQLGSEIYIRTRDLLWKTQQRIFEEEKRQLKSSDSAALSTMFWLAQLLEIDMYLISEFGSHSDYKESELMMYKESSTLRGHLISNLFEELKIGDEFNDLELALFTVPTEKFKDEIDYFIFSSGETIYEREKTRRKWLNQLLEMSKASDLSLIPNPCDYPNQILSLTPISFYINFLSKEMLTKILYFGSDKSPIKCDQPKMLYKMFRFLNKHGIIQINKEETYKLVRVLFDIKPKYYARYPLEFPSFRIPEQKTFSSHFKSTFKIIFEQEFIHGSKNEISKLVNRIFPFQGMSISMIEKSLKPSSGVYLNSFTKSELIMAMNSEFVEN